MSRAALFATVSVTASLALASCEREPRMPAERAAAVQEARSDLTSAEKKLAEADQPREVIGASKDLSTAATDFQQRRDAAIAATRSTLEQMDRDIRQIVDARAEIEFQNMDEARKTDAAIQDLVAARADLEATLELMRIATIETWPPLERRVDALSSRLRTSRQTALDGLY